MDVETLTVFGCLRWDTSKEGLELHAAYVLLNGDGYLEIGTEGEPMSKRATVRLRQGAQHPEWGGRFLFGLGNSRVRIHGRALGRPWTLLAQTAQAGDTTLHLKHDAHAMGWRVGDTVGIATTNRGRTRPYTITAVAPSGSIEVDPPLTDVHMGGLRHIRLTGGGGTFDGRFELAAEVINLQRSVVITGESNWDTPTREGLHTGMQSTGFMDVRYARVENCGQPPRKGRYCLHFHRMHRCPRCVFQGNAIVNSTQGGITVHGTHGSLVDQNVLWNTASVGIYLEDGNEMNNTISKNVIICMHRVPPDAINPNKPAEHCQQDLHDEPGRLGGIFVIGMTNDLVDNRIVNMENGIWFKGSADPNGRGAASGRLCVTHAPFGKISGNVCHDNRRFGIYPDFQLPRNLVRDDDGMLPKHPDGYTDWTSCDELTADGRDNGVQPANVIEDELDYHNMFVGQYSMGDVEYRRYVSINNAHCMYWKSSKNFADRKSYHMRDSICISDKSDPVYPVPSGHLFGPAGAFTFILKNVTFAGDPGYMGAVSAGQHCMLGGAGGPCNVQYLMESVDFSGVARGRRHVNFGAHSEPPGEVLPVFLARDDSLGGHRAVVSGHLDGFKQEGCKPLGAEHDDGLGCPFSVRRFNVWTKDLGPVRLRGPGYEVPANSETPTLGQNAGFLQYAKGYNGYGALAIPGKSYRLETQFASGIHVDFSDWFLPKFFGISDESVHLATDLGKCVVRAADAGSRYYGRFGPYASASQGDCRVALGGGGAEPAKPEPAKPGGTSAPARPPKTTAAPPKQGQCHTAVPEDECFGHVEWAMEHGIHEHPEHYPGLTPKSSFEDFQAHLYKFKHGSCPMPCAACHTAVAGEECYGHVAWAMQHGIRQNPAGYEGLTGSSSFEDFQNLLSRIGHGSCPHPCPPNDCHTAVHDEECYGHVVWAREQGIKLHPDVYEGLTTSSSFEAFQAFLNRISHGTCPPPCPKEECHTAIVGEECHGHVVWAKEHGVRRHPDGYDGLTSHSSLEEFQAYLHRMDHGDCPKPCPPGQPPQADGERAACHTAKAGEECFAHVAKVVVERLREHPSRDKGLTAEDLFEEEQERLHQHGLGQCPRPCPASGEAFAAVERFETYPRPLLSTLSWPPPLAWDFSLGLALAAMPVVLVGAWRFRERHRWTRVMPA